MHKVSDDPNRPHLPQTIWIGMTVYPIKYRESPDFTGAFAQEPFWLAEIEFDGRACGGWGYTPYLAYMHLRDSAATGMLTSWGYHGKVYAHTFDPFPTIGVEDVFPDDETEEFSSEEWRRRYEAPSLWDRVLVAAGLAVAPRGEYPGLFTQGRQARLTRRDA